MERLSSTEGLLHDLVDEGIYCRGIQACVSHHGSMLMDAAIGESTPPMPMSANTLHNLWCCTKPIVALGAALLIEDGALSPDEAIERRLPHFERLQGSGVTLGGILNHSAGLLRPNAFEVRTALRERQEGLVRAGSPVMESGHPVAGYSDFMGWMVLCELINQVSGAEPARFLHDRVLKPLELCDTYFSLAGTTYLEVRQDIGVYFADLPYDPTPLLHDRVRSVAADCSPALGGYGTMSDVHSWYRALLRVLSGGGAVPGMPQQQTIEKLLSIRRGHTYDAILRRECDFAAGFMVDLGHHSFGKYVSPEAVGHAGWLGTSWAWADPTYGLAAAFLINGVPAGMEDIDLLRRTVNDTLYQDLLDDR